MNLWRSPAFSAADAAAEPLPDGATEVLGRMVRYPPHQKDAAGLEGLRLFHLHYGEEILGCARRGDERYLDAARAGLAAWIDANPPAKRESWHPYQLSTRIGNWIAAISLEPSLASALVSENLWRQLAYLERNVEDDILGNHVIRNARALVLGGLAFGARNLVARGLDLLSRELPEQILPDGGHYERSPVYHALVLRDLLEIRAAVGTSELDDAIEHMAKFAAWLNRPDGRPALFNDGGLDLAPDLADALSEPEQGLELFSETGYAVVRDGLAVWLAFDCGVATPAFIPPHAHADALSFQLWVGGKPLVVDPGTFTYERGPERDWFRGTRSHSTVSVDGQDQFQFIGSFRAIGIPRVNIIEVSGSEREGSVVAEFEGFRYVVGAVRHRRRLSWSPTDISIEDQIDGHGSHIVESTLPLAPTVELKLDPVIRADDVVVEAIGPLECAIEERWVSERFFQHAPAHAVVACGETTLPVTVGWKLQLPQRASVDL